MKQKVLELVAEYRAKVNNLETDLVTQIENLEEEVSVPVPEITGFSAVVQNEQTVNISITSVPPSTAKIKLTSISTIGRETGNKVGPNVEYTIPTMWPKSISGFHPGWQIDVQAIALDTAGNELVRSSVLTVQMPGDPTVQWPPVSVPQPQPQFPTQGTVYNARTLGLTQAVSQSKAGDTILLPAGTYNLMSTLQIPERRLVLSTEGAVVHVNSSYAFNTMGPGVRIVGITFDSGGIKFDRNTDGCVIDNCIFRNLVTDAIYSGAKLINVKFTNNLFENFNKFAFMTYGGYSNITIANNEFVNVFAGPHVDAQQGSGPIVMEQNYFSGVGTGPFSELQGGASSAVIRDNWAEKPKLSSTRNQNNYALGHSDPLNSSTNILIKNNVIIAPEAPDGTGIRYGFEIGGSGLIEENYIEMKNVCFGNTDGSSQNTTLTIRNNVCKGTSRIVETSFPNPTRKVIQSNNGPNVDLNWLLQRGRPGRNRRF